MQGDDARSDSQRVQEIDRLGGLITAALPRSDGTVLASEGSSIIRLDLSSGSSRVLGRADLGHGEILALAESASFQFALSEDGLIVLAGSDMLPSPVGFTPGSGQALAIQGDLVLIAAREAGLRVLRIDPSGTAVPLAVLSMPGGALDVAFGRGGATAFVASGQAGIHQIDLADPATPYQVQTLNAIASADSVALAGSLLAVGSNGHTLLVDPASAEQPIVGRYAPLHDGHRLYVEDEFAYVADASDGLKILWLAAPDRPVQLYGEVDRPASDLWFEGNTLYVVGPGSLRILDVGNRYYPLEIASLPLVLPSDQPAEPHSIAVAEGRAFIALGDQGIAVVDVSNLAAPRLSSLISMGASADAVLYHDGYLYAACGEAGLAIIDARQPGSETLKEIFPLPGISLDLARRGSVLFVAAQTAGLVAVDIIHPDTPIIRGVLPPQTGKSILSLSISGKRAFLSEGDDFLVADVSRADHLGRLARVDAPAQHVYAGDTTLYALSGSQIAIYDAGATAEPTYLRTYAGMRQVGHITVWGDYAFVADAGDGPDAVVLSLLAPDHPYELDSVGQAGHSYQVSASPSGIYLAAGFGGLHAYQLSEGGALVPRGRYSTFPETDHLAASSSYLLAGGRMGWSVIGQEGSGDLPVRAMALDGDTLAVAAGDASIALYSLANPAAPQLLARRDTPGPALGVALDGSFVYIADSGGLSIYDRTYLSSVRHVATPAAATGVTLRGGLAYLSLENGSLAVIEVGDPFGGIQAGSSVDMSHPADLFFGPDGHSIYALAGTTLDRLAVDAHSRLFIDQTGALPEVAGQGTFLQEGVLAALMPGEAFRLIDTSQLETQTSIYNTMKTPAEDIAIDWPVGYAAYGTQGLGLIDIRNLTAGTIFYPEEVDALYRQGDTLFALGESLTAWDINQPAQPDLLATLPLAAPGRHIDGLPGSDDLLLSLEGGVTIVHWDGKALTETSTLFTSDAIDRAAWIGQRGYLALHDGGLLVVDLSDPARPVSLFTYTSSSGHFVSDLLPLADSRLLVSWEGGIDMLDVSSATATPRLLGVTASDGPHALGVALSPDGSQAAVALGESGAALFSLADPRSPQLIGSVDTPGGGLAVALDGTVLYVADGLCGLRIFDVSKTASPPEVGYWRSGYVGDVLVQPGAAGQTGVTIGGANQIATLHYDPNLPPVSPPVPQSPDPADGQADALLTANLSWTPLADSCDPLVYDVYFGQGDDPAYLAQVGGSPHIEVPNLTSLRSYSWRVEAVDRQGDRTVGPLWHFTTLATDFADTIPPAPPTFQVWVEDHPFFSVVAGGFLSMSLIILALRWLRPKPHPISDTTPEWYSTNDDEEP
jgi:hypothetical protein